MTETGSPPLRPEPSPLAAGMLALVVMVQFCAASWLWPLLQDAWLVPKRNYRTVWASSGFRGLPIDDVARGLNQRLPIETPIKLSPGLEGQGQWAQRLKEGLYPRRVQPDAAFTLDLIGSGSPNAIAQSPQGAFVLVGKLPPAPAVARSGTTDLGISWGRLLLHAFAAFGWGAALAMTLKRLRGRAAAGLPLLAGAGLGGPVLFGFLGTMATVAQVPLPWSVLTVTGTALGLAVLALEVKRTVASRTLGQRFAWIRHPETWAIGILAAVLVRHMAIWPLIGWDGRSIWLYRAKQVAYNGYLTAADAANPLNFFSHMEYPLLFPSWMALFGTMGPLREPELAVGAVLLHLGLIACLWFVSRRRLGRWVGAAFVGAAFVVTAGSVERGYADGLVTLFLLIMAFSLDDADLEPFGWLAGLGAALTKREGMIFAAVAGALFMLLHPRFRAKPWLRRFLPGLVILPAAAQVLWARAVGIKDSHAGAKLPATFDLMADRAQIIWTGVASIARQSNPIAHFLAALIAYLVLESLGRRSWLSRMLAGTAGAVVLFSFMAMMITPYDVAWQVSTAMERVLLHGVFALFAAVLVALTTREQTRPS